MKIPSKSYVPDCGDLAARVRRARTDAKLTQAALAREIGVSASAVAQWEKADGTRPGLPHMVAISRLTGVALDWLATGEGKPRRKSGASDEPILVHEVYAHDLVEESLLKAFRRIPTRSRRLLAELFLELGEESRRVRKRG